MFHDCRTIRRSRRRASTREYAWLSPRGAVTDPAEALAAGGNLRFQYGRDAVTQAKIRRPDNAGCRAQIAVTTACAFRRDALHKFRLADYPEFFRPIGAIHRPHSMNTVCRTFCPLVSATRCSRRY